MNAIRDFYRQRLNQVMAARSLTDLTRSALVLAPHPDDETLGCGGTIIRKIAAGADVQLVFMTDGSRSHAALMPESKLRDLRQKEAMKAAQVLGVPFESVTFLEFGDGQLSQNKAQAIAAISKLLKRHRPAEVFMPYSLEPPPDHAVTYHAAIAALNQLSLSPTIYTYPIWYWQHWPWTKLVGNSRRETLGVIKASLISRLGTAMFQDFQHSVSIREVLEQKQLALNQHQSQMQRFDDNLAWPILADVSDGEFLACFFQDYEIFHRPRA